MKRHEVVSPEYCRILNRMHIRCRWGADGHTHARPVMEMIYMHGYATVLDYGCGQGMLKKTLHRRARHLYIAEYDPGIPDKKHMPHPADLVVCTDVLEHIEPEKLNAVLSHLRELAEKALYIVISLRPARKILPDGRNAHLIVQNAEWWYKKLHAFFPHAEITELSRRSDEITVSIIR